MQSSLDAGALHTPTSQAVNGGQSQSPSQPPPRCSHQPHRCTRCLEVARATAGVGRRVGSPFSTCRPRLRCRRSRVSVRTRRRRTSFHRNDAKLDNRVRVVSADDVPRSRPRAGRALLVVLQFRSAQVLSTHAPTPLVLTALPIAAVDRAHRHRCATEPGPYPASPPSGML